MNCPLCDAAMDLRQVGTPHAHWGCPFDQQIVWANGWIDAT